jgi:hypothetical protein
MNLKFKGLAIQAVYFLQKEQSNDPVTWTKFVDQFHIQEDHTNQG